MSATLLGEFIVDQEFTLKFSRASGDYNSLHTDPILARRYQFGSTVVHGVCATLKALDIYLETTREAVTLVAINALYSKPIRIGDRVKVLFSQRESGEIKLELVCRGYRSQQIKLTLASGSDLQPTVSRREFEVADKKSACTEIQFEDSQDRSGVVPLFWQEELVSELFPDVARFLPSYQTCLMMGTTNIVGMDCPGLNSVYGSFRLLFSDSPAEFHQHLDYKVTLSDHRFSRIIMTLDHPAVEGEIEAFFRAKPIEQCSASAIKQLVHPDEFLGQTALIIGGSRGLGEIIAKLVGAGGGRVFLTYSSGKSDAEAVADDIRSIGGECDSIFYDVLDAEPGNSLIPENVTITHLYFFASPKIEKSMATVWDAQLFSRFTSFYLTGFASLLESFIEDIAYRKNGVDVFVPSTEFLDVPIEGFSEYITSKAAVESFSRQFQSKYPAWRISTPRLPRLATDQTASILQDSPIRAAEVMLAQLKESWIKAGSSADE